MPQYMLLIYNPLTGPATPEQMAEMGQRFDDYTKSLVDLFTFIILLATLAVLIPYVFCALAGLLIAPRGQSRASTRDTVLAILAFVFSFGAIVGAGASVVFWGFLLLLAGVPVYVWVRRPGVAEGR